ncbi:MAG: serine hydrolase [Planctomycetes bacterium]|nr:serine hydrolase [Planctomycetota bacterium]
MRLLAALVGPLIAFGSCATTPSSSERVEAVFRSLSLEQKAGQLFVAWCLSREEGQNHEELIERVRGAGLGGVILSLGTALDAARLVPRLQAASAVPLLMAGDFEGGVWFRLAGATELGNQMLVGATGSEHLAERMGSITAQEAKALGFHVVFAPVLDVNSNPDNPIVNVRSFGEDPEQVARLGAAFVRGVNAEGLIACGKHFPGHGDVATDSHIGLPAVPGDGARLRRVELRPFAAAIDAGLGAVMTGHLSVPGLGEDPAVPATLSSRVLHGVLRDELHFRGLVVTDALDMGGVKGALPPGEVAVRALLAGADVLLMPPDPFAARDAVVEAVRSGRVPMARLDDAVRRILAAKERAGLLGGGGGVAPDWPAALRTADAERTADTIAARGVTLVRDRHGRVPLSAKGGPALLVAMADKDEGQGVAFAAALGDLIAPDVVRISGTSTDAAIEIAAAKVATAARVVLALDVRVRENRGSLGLPPRLQPVLAALGREQEVVAVSFGDPYVGRALPFADVYVCAFAATVRVERQVAAALRGEAPFVGHLPIGIPGVAGAGDGCMRLVGTDVPRGASGDQDMAGDLEERVAAVLDDGVASPAFPGAVCLVARRGVRVAAVAAGRESYDEGAPAVRLDTTYDLASLTKVTATLPAVLTLVARGSLRLDDPVGRWLSAFAEGDKAGITVRHLLRHRSGLPAWEPFHRSMQGKDAIVAAIASTPLVSPPGAKTRYSDLGFMLLGAVVEAASGEPFAEFVAREVFARLGMRGARFAPLDEPPIDAAPTELDPARGGVLRGRVHDENAFAMGGVAGHAGLFATADDVLRLGTAMLAGGRSVWPPDLVAAVLPGGDDRGLAFGPMGGGAFGHTGFTGTSVWCEPRTALTVVLLTNRVHPSRQNAKIEDIRRRLHEVVLAAVR